MVGKSIPNDMSATNRQAWLYNISRGKSVDTCKANEHTSPYSPVKQQQRVAGKLKAGLPLKNKTK